MRVVLGFGWDWVVLGTGVEGAYRVRAAVESASAMTRGRSTRRTAWRPWCSADGSRHLVGGRAACDPALGLLAPLGDDWALGHAEGLRGELAEAEQRYPDAKAHLARAAGSAGALGFEAAQAHHLLNLARVEVACGEGESARTTLVEAIEIARRCGDFRTVAVARTHLALVLRAAGEPDAALACVEQAVSWFAAAGGGDGAALAHDTLAALRAAVPSAADGDRHAPVAQ